MQKLSAVVITLNEEKHIERCLGSLVSAVDEILVLDSGSTDKTLEIAQRFLNVKIYQVKWLGYADTKNLGNSLASYDWIISVDADESLSADLVNSILEWKQMEASHNSGFNRANYFNGIWIKNAGWYPDFKWRIFNRNTTKWIGTIHEQLKGNSIETNSPILLKGDCLHFSYSSVDELRQQSIKFAKLGAFSLFERKRFMSWFKIFTSPLFRFFKSFVLQRGFLDGRVGFWIAWYSAYELFVKYNELRKLIFYKKDKFLL